MEKEKEKGDEIISIEKGKYFLADVSDVKNLTPVALINGDNGNYVFWDCAKQENLVSIQKKTQIGLFVAEDGDEKNFMVFELKEKTKAIIDCGAIFFGIRFLLLDEKGRCMLTSLEDKGASVNNLILLELLQNVFACDNLEEVQKTLQNPRYKETIKFLLNNLKNKVKK